MPVQVRWAFLLALVAALLTACAPRIPPPAPQEIAPVPAGFPESFYREAETLGRKVLQVDPHQSLVAIEVHRGGPLARLGHDHMVTSHDVRGYVALDDGRADLYIPVDRLVVDEPALRAQAGFDTQPSKEAVEATRRNMLEKVLESDRFPFVLIRATPSNADRSQLNVSITLHGITRTMDVPVQIETLPRGVSVSGKMTVNQTDFGIAPFSVLGGALQVQDRLDLRFRIFATRR